MPIINRISDYYNEMREWRQYIHANPELGFECHKTAAFVVERLREFGIEEIHEGIAKTGVVAIINGSKPGKTIGLRADMDALPLQEIHDHEYKSKNPGKMHACGHDGHTTMLLGAARYLAETRNFSGRVALIFQPAEEGGGGGEVMVKEGIIADKPVKQLNHADIQTISDYIHVWQVKPNGTEGYRTAEVTLGGVDTDELSSKTFVSKKQPGLFFIGEVIDVTGWLGGYNFQFCWASGYACGQAV